MHDGIDPQKQAYWQSLEKLAADHTVIIDRSKGQPHPSVPEMIYPLDYGYLQGTKAADGSGMDVWLGSKGKNHLNGIVLTVDLEKHDAEIKLLLDCTASDIDIILSFYQQHELSAMAVLRKEIR